MLKSFSVRQKIFGHDTRIKVAEAIQDWKSQDIIEEKKLQRELERENQLVYSHKDRIEKSYHHYYDSEIAPVFLSSVKVDYKDKVAQQKYTQHVSYD